MQWAQNTLNFNEESHVQNTVATRDTEQASLMTNRCCRQQVGAELTSPRKGYAEDTSATGMKEYRNKISNKQAHNLQVNQGTTAATKDGQSTSVGSTLCLQNNRVLSHSRHSNSWLQNIRLLASQGSTCQGSMHTCCTHVMDLWPRVLKFWKHWVFSSFFLHSTHQRNSTG